MKFIPKIIILAFLFTSVTNLFAQTNIDKASELNKLAISENQNKNYDKAAEYIEEAIKIASKEQNIKLDGELRYTAAIIYSNKNEESLSLKYFLSSANFFEQTNDFEKLSEIFSQTQLIYFHNEAFEKAAENGKKAIFYHKKNKSSFEKTSTVIEKTGDSYFYLPNIDSAIVYFSILKQDAVKNKNIEKRISALIKLSKSYKILKDYNNALQTNIELNELYLKKQDYAGMAVSSNNIAYNYMLLKEYTKATAGFFAAIALSNKAGNSDDFVANTYLNIGVCMQNNNNLQDAIININKAVDIRKKNGQMSETAKALNILALTYFNSGDLYNASTNCEESIEYALKSTNKKVLSDCYRTYSMILQEGNDYEKALEIYKKHLSITDSLMLEQKIHDHKLAQRIFELERSEKELKLKLADDQVKNLALKQLILESEKKEKELELLKKDKELEESEKERLLQIVKLAEEQNKTLLNKQEIKNLEAQKAMQELQLKQKEIEKREKEKEVALLHSESDKQKLLLEKQKEEEQKLRWIFGLVIIISALILYALMISRKANRKLAKQKRQIQEKNEELKLQNEEIKAQKEYLQDANNEISTQKQQIEIKNEEITSSIK